MNFRYVIAAAALIAIPAAAWSQDGLPAFPPAKVQVAVAEVRNMAPTVEVSGTVVSLNDSRIAAEVEGVLTWVADVGDAPSQGVIPVEATVQSFATMKDTSGDSAASGGENAVPGLWA